MYPKCNFCLYLDTWTQRYFMLVLREDSTAQKIVEEEVTVSDRLANEARYITGQALVRGGGQVLPESIRLLSLNYD